MTISNQDKSRSAEVASPKNVESDVSLSEDNDLMQKVLETARHLAGPYELNEMLGQIIDAGRSVLSADRGTVFLFDEDARELYLEIGTGLEELRFSIDKGIAGECARTRKIINVKDCYQDHRFNQEVDRQTGYKTNTLLAVPLVGLEDKLVGVLQMLNASKGHFEKKDEQLADAFGSHAAVAIQRAVLLEERVTKLKMERDLQLAREIQMRVLPSCVPEVDGYDLASFSQPADETGGDMYDLIPVGDEDGQSGNLGQGLIILLADATGHGIGPALSVTQVRAMLRVGTRLKAGIDDLVGHINNQVTDDLASERFVTAFIGVLDQNKNQIIYHSAGQGPLLLVKGANGQCTFMGASTLPLGIMTNPPMDDVEPLCLEVGDLFILLTDGFYEYANDEGVQFGNEGVGKVISEHRHESAQEILDALLDALWTFADGASQDDDLTAIIIKRV